MVNNRLLQVARAEDFVKMGFKEEDDGTGDFRGVSWTMQTKNYRVFIDAFFEVSICRLNPDTDYIILHVEDLIDLQSVIDWIAD